VASTLPVIRQKCRASGNALRADASKFKLNMILYSQRDAKQGNDVC
jgi:hypothetical protein